MKKIIIAIAAALIATSAFAQNDYQIAVFGSLTDGVTDNTATIQKAIDFISDKGGGTLTFAVGRYLTGAVVLKDNVTLNLGEGAVLVAAPNIYCYKGKPALISAEGASNVAVIGKGCIEGSAKGLKAQIADQVKKGYITSSDAPAIISFKDCTNAKVDGIKIVNPAAATIEGAEVSGVHVYDYAAGKVITPEGKTIKIQK